MLWHACRVSGLTAHAMTHARRCALCAVSFGCNGFIHAWPVILSPRASGPTAARRRRLIIYRSTPFHPLALLFFVSCAFMHASVLVFLLSPSISFFKGFICTCSGMSPSRSLVFVLLARTAAIDRATRDAQDVHAHCRRHWHGAAPDAGTYSIGGYSCAMVPASRPAAARAAR